MFAYRLVCVQGNTQTTETISTEVGRSMQYESVKKPQKFD